MPQEIDLKEIEKKAFRSFHRDGFWEIFFGMLMFAGVVRDTLPEMGAKILFSQIVSIALTLTGPLVYVLGKKLITVPRLGYVRFGPARKRRLRWLHIFILATIILTVLILIFISKGNQNNLGSALPHHFLSSIIITLLILLAISFIAYFLDYPRLYFVAVLVAAHEPAYFYLKHYTDVTQIHLFTYGIPALILLFVGVITFVGFLRKYPKQGVEEYDANI